jgi:endonuclease YncB( thermonuclease family)
MKSNRLIASLLMLASLLWVAPVMAAPPDLPDLPGTPLWLAPEPAWTTEAEVVSVYDGDTFTVEVRRRFEVRVIDCWSPELDAHDERERQLARESRDHMKQLVARSGNKVIVSVPGVMRKRDGFYDPGDSTSLTRILGHVWLMGDKWPINERQIAAGHATRKKE